MCVCVSVCVFVYVHACTCVCFCVCVLCALLCSASCWSFLMQHRTASPGLRRDFVMVFFLPVLAGNENQLLRCCHRRGAVCFPFHFHPWYLPNHSYRRNRAALALFPSVDAFFNDLAQLSVFFFLSLQKPLQIPAAYLSI